MFIRPHTLSLITTHQCTAACDHCCFHCTPKVTKAIPHDRLHALVDEAARISSFRLIAFTGGECFLLGTVLDELIERATNHKLATRCVTNGYWAASSKGAARRIESAARSGLKEINISTGSFHSKYVPAKNVINAAIAAVGAGITTLINVELFAGSNFDLEEITTNSTLKVMIDEKKLLVQRSFWIDNAGSVPIDHKPEHSRFQTSRIDGCKTALNVIAVTPDLDVIACCGLHMERIPDLHIGTVRDQTLGEAIAKAADDFLKIWIHVAGPERILQFVKQRRPDYDLPLNSVHPCETCLHLYNSPDALEVISANYKEAERDIVPLFLAGIMKERLNEVVGRRISELQVEAASFS
ncbi:radical SAM protein [Xanthobacter versatilis]|uniref:radical SAM protein n=1 Tax=Xanthobacter autotrophicus (strain ATCC BAA-1158 / Py2) TaxID=78245 RepID=UPI003727F2E0